MKKTYLMFAGALLLSAHFAMASDAPEYELVCRSKAKEIAAETYRGCVVEARTTQIDQLKKEYQERLRQMKDDYEKQLKQLSGGSASKSTGSSQSTSLPKKNLGKKIASKPKLQGVMKQTTIKTGNGIEEMTVELKSAPAVNSDDSTLDIPEPTPIENVPTTDSAAI